jgi:4-aminobutyrate aminotransferase-like enzyme
MPTQTATAGAPSTVATASNYHDYVNPQWVTLLSLLGMNVEYERCFGCELFTKDGLAILDFLSGYCVHNIGHNLVLKAAPPLIVTDEQLDKFVQAIRDLVELAETSPAFWTEALGMARRAVNI